MARTYTLFGVLVDNTRCVHLIFFPSPAGARKNVSNE